MQVYAGVETLTNQPSAAERARGAAPPRRLSAARRRRARWARTRRSRTRRSTRAAERGALPLVVGGTGLYLRAALADLALPPARAGRASGRAGSGSTTSAAPSAALAELARRDPRAAGRLHANDRRRVVRALELAAQGASLRARARPAVGRGHARGRRVVAVVSWPRAELRARIAARTDAMLAGGAVDEVRALRASGVEPSPTAARILGLAQIGAYLDGARDARRRARPRSRCARAVRAPAGDVGA